jgi:hypothetical protein
MLTVMVASDTSIKAGLSSDNLNGRAANPNSGGPAGALASCERASPVPGGWIPLQVRRLQSAVLRLPLVVGRHAVAPACRQTSFTGTPASACLRIETIWVSVKFDFFMEPPGCENMPGSSTSVVSTQRGSLRIYLSKSAFAF